MTLTLLREYDLYLKEKDLLTFYFAAAIQF